MKDALAKVKQPTSELDKKGLFVKYLVESITICTSVKQEL